MKVDKAVGIYITYLENNCRKNTLRTFKYALLKFSELYAEKMMNEITETDIIEFISFIAEDCKTSTKNNRVNTIKSFYNFIMNYTDVEYVNPCEKQIVKKLFKCSKLSAPRLLEKDLIDEIIYRTVNTRNRLILELMGRSGMRIGEVLNVNYQDIDFDNLTIHITEPKSGRTGEKVYITKKLASKLQIYINSISLNNGKLFDISYSTAYRIVRKSGKIVGSFLRPHDLRRHAATQASRSGVPLEVVSKIILRHANIATTQRYLGSIDHEEALMWVEHLNR